MKRYIKSSQSTAYYESIKGTPLIFAMARITPTYITIDGYSNKSTIKGALKDLAKAVAKYSQSESDAILDMINFDEICQYPANNNDGYVLEWEEVPSASRHVDADGVDTLLSNRDDTYENFDVEYKPAKWYLMIRIVR